MVKAIDMTGFKINEWTVLRRDYTVRKNSAAYWVCQCSCDNKTIRIEKASKIKAEMSNSCRKCAPSSFSKNNTYDLSGECGIGYTEDGREFYFDLEDYNLIKDYYWNVDTVNYVKTVTSGKRIKMHRLIMDAKEDEFVDHIFHVKNDNRKSQLRVVTHAENMMNKKAYKNNTSGHKGVYRSKNGEKWIVTISIDKKQREMGRFDSLEEAIKVRKELEIKYYGEYRYKDKEEK